MKQILVTGGAGFIGSNFILHWLGSEASSVINLDKLTYAGNLSNLRSVSAHERHSFVQGDINDRDLVSGLLESYQPDAVVHFAAESHVDRSIHGAEEFIQTNVVGTFNLLQEVRHYWSGLEREKKRNFRFLHISTDEVYGSLSKEAPAFCETTAYAPNSPYSASKASADHLVRAFHHTYDLPTLTTNCSNNYGPYQFPEKLIPLMIHNAISGLRLPVYGDGQNVRDWIYVADHCEAVRTVLNHGKVGHTYNIGGESEQTNLDVVKGICAVLADLRPGADYEALIEFVKDRPGHDKRYAIDIRKIRQELGWCPTESFSSGLSKTVRWYLGNPDWVSEVTSGSYRKWIDLNYKSESRQAMTNGR
ncbi:MAG TPA: dTDP-glucose 4,6-dehydratase [Candidatus Angelobacter sp.]|nr:dTDP-glucose 4,6-dehydratase [Candidatus Angelobacter sp.]